jgi:hypothetical protein
MMPSFFSKELVLLEFPRNSLEFQEPFSVPWIPVQGIPARIGAEPAFATTIIDRIDHNDRNVHRLHLSQRSSNASTVTIIDCIDRVDHRLYRPQRSSIVSTATIIDCSVSSDHRPYRPQRLSIASIIIDRIYYRSYTIIVSIKDASLQTTPGVFVGTTTQYYSA